MALRIRNWNDHYENNRSRVLRRMDWVPIRNRQDGLGYIRLLDHPNGPAHFGAWIALVQIASKCDKRGVLWKDGVDLTPTLLSSICRFPASLLEEAIARLLEIGWLESDSGQIHHTDVHDVSATSPQRQRADVVNVTPLTSPTSRTDVNEGRKERKEESGARCDAKSDPLAEADWSSARNDEQLATTLVSMLMPHHPAGGANFAAVSAAASILADEIDPEAMAELIRKAHEQFRPFWAAERKRNPRHFIPKLDRWLMDGDWRTPPLPKTMEAAAGGAPTTWPKYEPPPIPKEDAL